MTYTRIRIQEHRKTAATYGETFSALDLSGIHSISQEAFFAGRDVRRARSCRRFVAD
jgi:hypothetical protein